MACYFCCPKCTLPLAEQGNVWRCKNGHSYDRSRYGYVNLLPPSGKSTHGDDKEMVQSRHAFLSRGYYAPLCRALCETVLPLLPQQAAALDCGCGEGYYTSSLYRAAAERGFALRMSGVDLSKNAMALAARREREISWAVSSVYALPVPYESQDLLLCVFSPFADGEYYRVLKKGGHLVYVFPLKEHLLALKEAVYDTPYLNPEHAPDAGELRFLTTVPVRYDMTLTCGEDIQALFAMTPYAHRTPKKGWERLGALTSLAVTAAFGISVYRKD